MKKASAFSNFNWWAAAVAVACFILLSALLPSKGFASPNKCEAAFIDPGQLLSTSFGLNENGVRALWTRFKVSRLDFSKPLSVRDLEMLVLNLDESRFGSATKWRDLIDRDRSRFAARVARAQKAEIATRGLISYFESRDLIRDKSRFRTKLRQILRSPKTQVLLSAQSLFSILSPVPMVIAPNLSLFKITADQFETLALFGLESPEGQSVLDALVPKHQRDLRFSLFIRSFNKTSLILATWMLVNLVTTEDTALAQKNGQAFAVAVTESTNKLEKELAGPILTKDDIHFDETVKLLVERGLTDTPELRAQLCAKFPAPNRCAL